MLKNFLFYAFSTFINTWAGEAGGGEVFRVFGIVSLVLIALCIPMCKCHPQVKELRITDSQFVDVFGKLNRKLMYNLYTRSALLKSLG